MWRIVCCHLELLGSKGNDTPAASVRQGNGSQRQTLEKYDEMKAYVADPLARTPGRGPTRGPDQESLSVGHKTGALETKDLERVAVDTTVQPKAITHPTDAGLMHRALQKLVELGQAPSGRAAPRAICGWPSEPPSWSGATPMPIN